MNVDSYLAFREGRTIRKEELKWCDDVTLLLMVNTPRQLAAEGGSEGVAARERTTRALIPIAHLKDQESGRLCHMAVELTYG